MIDRWTWLHAEEPLDGADGFSDFRVASIWFVVGSITDTATEVFVEETETDIAKRAGYRGGLGECVDAVLVVFDLPEATR